MAAPSCDWVTRVSPTPRTADFAGGVDDAVEHDFARPLAIDDQVRPSRQDQFAGIGKPAGPSLLRKFQQGFGRLEDTIFRHHRCLRVAPHKVIGNCNEIGFGERCPEESHQDMCTDGDGAAGPPLRVRNHFTRPVGVDALLYGSKELPLGFDVRGKGLLEQPGLVAAKGRGELFHLLGEVAADAGGDGDIAHGQ